MNLLSFEEYCDAKIDEIEAVISGKSLEYIDDFSVHSGWLGLSLFYSMLATYKQDDGSFDALKGLGKRVKHINLPYEEHIYQAEETKIFVLEEMDKWLNQHLHKDVDLN